MSELLQSGQHPDADQLNAFVEQALPPHEHEQTLAHLAICPDCRAIVSLSLPFVDELPQPLPARRRWFSGWNLAWPVAVASAAMALVILHVDHGSRTASNSAPPTQIAASYPPEVPAPAAPQPAPTAVPMPAPLPPPAAQLKTSAPHSPAHAANATPVAPQALIAPADDAKSAAGPIDLNVQLGRSPLTRQVEVTAASPSLGGGIQGTITDPSGARIRDAQIIATNTDTGVQTLRRSNDFGIYSIAPLPPGPYNVEVVARGFQRLLQENVTVDNASVVGLNPKLTVGGQNETVTITDAPPFLDTSNASLGGTIENQLYSQLPLSMNGGPRDPTAFQYVMPGVQANPNNRTGTGATRDTGQGAGAGGSAGISGGTGQTNLTENYLEGMPISNAAAQPKAAPPPPPPPAAPPLPSQAAGRTQTATAAVPPQRDTKNTLAVDSVDQFTVTGRASAGVSSAAADGLTLAVARGRSAARPLPSGLAILSVATAGHQMLAIDTANALFLSSDDGLHWTAIHPQWKGHAVKVDVQPTTQSAAVASAPPQPQAAAAAKAKSASPASTVFSLTTDTAEHWVSEDGQTWKRQ